MDEKMGQWESGCKRCGGEMKYSDRSYKVDIKRGFSRPEYCKKCQQEEVKGRSNMGISYVSFKVKKGANLTGFGELNQPGRNHILTFGESEFDEDQFGLTPNKIKELADWFKDPKHRAAVVVGPTGSGKSTALPAWLMNPPKELGLPQDYFTREGQMIHTQPRINSADGQAEFVAKTLMGVDVGSGLDVGVINSNNKNSDRRNLWVSVTDGTFINLIVKGKLGTFGYVIIDEAHERSLNIDQILCLLKERLSLYPKIKIIIASATINAKKFQNFFGKDITAIIEFEGKERRVDGKLVKYKEFYQDNASALPYEDLSKLGKIIVESAYNKALSLASEIVSGKKDKGDILVFLQGVKPIETAVEKTREYICHDDALANIVEVHPLYRDLPNDEKKIINKHNLEDGKIWIIFSTNIAEASVTIDSLGYEIETGVENQSIFDASSNTTLLPLNLISRANAKQRWGRTGRTRNGEVYCLYTKDQFDNSNLFRDYPIPAIQRSSMEDTLLVMKAAGIPKPADGWIEKPSIEEIERSYTALVESEIFTNDGALTKRGLLLSNFSYPAKLVDFLFMADSLGIIVEIASLLPIIRNGGNKKIFEWKYSWDAYTKKDAFQKQKALISGCYDDVEFLLKIISLWTEIPWLSLNFLNKKNEEEIDIIRQDWAKRNFINIDVIEKIISERKEIFSHFFEDTKYENVGKIDFNLLPRIRQLLLTSFPEIKIRESQTSYEYDYSIKPEEGSNVSCNCLIQQSDLNKVDDWMYPHSFETDKEMEIISRLFIDQIYPINSRFLAVLTEGSTNILKRTGQVTSSVLYIKKNFIEEEIEEDEIEKDLDNHEIINNKLPETLKNLPINYDFVVNEINCQQILSKELEMPVDVEVVDYQFGITPAVIVQTVNSPEPFDEFVKHTKKGYMINVEVVKILSYPKDNHPTLVVKEPNSKMEILMEVGEITFSNASLIITKIPIGSILKVKVESFISEARRVYLSMLSQVEANFDRLFAKNNFILATTHVIEIRPDSVHFLVEWANLQEGFIPIVSVLAKMLPKLTDQYQLGDEVSMYITRGNKKQLTVQVSKIPKLIQSKQENNQLPDGFIFQDQNLRFKGKMSDLTRSNLKNISNNEEYQTAIDKLYWLSNRIQIKEFFDNQWIQETKIKYPLNTQVEAVIEGVDQQNGIRLIINGVYKAFLPRSNVLDCFRENLSQHFHIGYVVQSEVTEIRDNSKQLILKQITEEERPSVSTPILPTTAIPKIKTKTVTKAKSSVETIPKPKKVQVSTPKKSQTSPKINTTKSFQTGQSQTPTDTDLTLIILLGIVFIFVIFLGIYYRFH